MSYVIPDDLMGALSRARSVTVLTGAGVSAESGIPTFRDALTGLWSRYRAEDLATPQAFERDPQMVARWYDERRTMCMRCEPNAGHRALAQLQDHMRGLGRELVLVTQNVDRLHQRAGSEDVIELHGSIMTWRCTHCDHEQQELGEPFDSHPPRCGKCDGIRRPGVVWFGESLPDDALQSAHSASVHCDVFLSIGTSSQVYPAAGLMDTAAAQGARLLEVNVDRTAASDRCDWVLCGRSAQILPILLKRLMATGH